MDLKLKGKEAFVSGSTAGIGLAIATQLVEEGAEVIINGRTEERVTKAIADLHERFPHVALRGVAADLSTAAGVAMALETFPNVDILVNNLGIFEPKPFMDITDTDWVHFFSVNVLSGVRLVRGYLPGMKAKNWGRIIFISSESGLQIPPEMIHYGVTKTAQISLARGLAESLAGTGITVNSVLPGPTASEGVGKFVEDLARADGKSKAEVEKEFFKTMRPSSLLQRFASTAEVAAMVTYLCSEAASATTGAAVRVDGGVIRAIA